MITNLSQIPRHCEPGETDVIARSAAARQRKEQTSLRGAKRRGNLCQVVVAQIEAEGRCQEIAAPCGLAMTVDSLRARNNGDSLRIQEEGMRILGSMPYAQHGDGFVMLFVIYDVLINRK